MTRIENETLIRQLVDLGLSDLEAQTYIGLLQAGTTTAYQLAQAIGKPTANVYKAVQSLSMKGAVAVQSGKTRVLTAIAPHEFLGRIRRQFAELIEDASRGLATVRREPAGDQLYRFENVEAVFERACLMLMETTSIAVIDAFPGSLDRLEAQINHAMSRDVRVFLQTYAETTIKATSQVIAGDASRILKEWNCELLILIVDGREVLLALCTPDFSRVIEAYWSNSLFLACVQHAGLLREHFFHQMQTLLTDPNITPEMLVTLVREHPTFLNHNVPGREILRNRIAGTETIIS